MIDLSLYIVFWFFFTTTVIYTLYKVIWYCIKLIQLNLSIRSFGKYTQLTRKRKFLGVVFGKKGVTDILVKSQDQTYEVSILSFISTHSRWNIEKAEDKYYIEVRKYNNIFYNNYKNSGTEPQHSFDYRRESRFCRCVLNWTDHNDNNQIKKILLVYPTPKSLTYTDHQFNILASGAIVNGYEIKFLNDLKDELLSQKRKN